MAQLLHGSANPIGGQSAIIKFRWGSLPEALKFEQAKPFIKFALGENVKQTNWGSQYRSRFPQIRMGLNKYMLIFSQELESMKTAKIDAKNTRKDLELEVILQI